MADDRSMQEVLAKALHASDCGCPYWRTNHAERQTYMDLAEVAIATCQEATVDQKVELIGGEFETGTRYDTDLGRWVTYRRVVGPWRDDSP